MVNDVQAWTVSDLGHQTGPHSTVEIAMLVGAGRISRNALVWREGESGWLPVLSILPSAPPPPIATGYSPTPTASSQQSNRITAGILGILLGGLGIHKFVLGYNTAGLIMLLVSVLSCGFAAPIMHIIGLIEGIIYLTKTDEQFYNEYVATKRDWF